MTKKNLTKLLSLGSGLRSQEVSDRYSALLQTEEAQKRINFYREQVDQHNYHLMSNEFGYDVLLAQNPNLRQYVYWCRARAKIKNIIKHFRQLKAKNEKLILVKKNKIDRKSVKEVEHVHIFTLLI